MVEKKEVENQSKEDNDIDNLNRLLIEKNNQINSLNQELTTQKQINNKSKDYLLVLESKVVEFDKQKEIIKSLNSEINKLKNEVSNKNVEINSLKQELESSKLTESYILRLLDLRKNFD